MIHGPYGSGKTVLIQCKAAILAYDGQNVLIVVPSHLKVWYKNFLKESGLIELEKPYLHLISKNQFLKRFCHYEKIAHSSHVFVDELLWPYENNYPSLETTSSTYNGSSDSHICCDDWSMYNKKISDNISYECGYEESPSVSSSDISHSVSDNDISPFNSMSEEESNELYLQNNLPTVSDDEADKSYSSNHLESCKPCPLENLSTLDPNIRFLNLLETLLTKEKNQYHVWVAPHLHRIIKDVLICDRSSSDFGRLHPEVDQFIMMCQPENFPISRLITVMRTSKQINDFKIRKEWEDFCHKGYCNKNSIEIFLKNRFFQIAFGNYLGHAVSGR